MKYLVFLLASGVIALDAWSMYSVQQVTTFHLWLLLAAILVYGLVCIRIGRTGRK